MTGKPPGPHAAGRTLQRLYVAGILALLLAPLALTAVIAYRGARDAERRVAQDRLALARATALTASAFIETHLAAIRSLARSPDVTDLGGRPDLDGFLARSLADTPEWESVEVFEAGGGSIIGSGAGLRTANIADRDYFQEALASERVVVGRSGAGRRSGGTAVPVAAPVAFVNGARGVLLVWLSTARLNAAIEVTARDNGLDIALLDLDGRVFARSAPTVLDGAAAPASVEGGQSLPASGVRRVDGEAGELLAAAAPVEQTARWTALVLQPAATAFSPIRSQLRDQMAVLGLMALIIAAIAFLLSRRLSLSYERELEATRRVDEFVTAASHDLKTPLTVIKTLAHMLRRRAAGAQLAETTWFDETLTGIDVAVTKMANQINTLLDMSRLQQDRALDIAPREADLLAIIRRVVGEQQRTAARHRIRLDATDEPLVGSLDPERIERVLDNLIGNAVKYSPEGGEVDVTVRRVTDIASGPDERDAAEWAMIQVRDRGVGIPPADLPRVFDRFHRGANVTGRIKGSGIGLAGAKAIVAQHGGTIAVESREGSGSTFTVRLPLNGDPTPPVAPSAAARADPGR